MNLLENSFDLDRGDKVKIYLLSVAVTSIIGLLYFNDLTGLAIGVPGGFLWIRYSSKKLDRIRRNEFRNQFKDYLYSISSSFSSGKHFKESNNEAVAKLLEIYDEKSLIVRMSTNIDKALSMPGANEPEVLERLAMESGIDETSSFLASYKNCRETGGDIITAVNKTAYSIAEKIRIENEIRVMVSQKKMEGRIIASMPTVSLIFMRLVSPEYVALLYGSIQGKLVMASVFLINVLAYLWIVKITEIEV